MPGIGFKLLLCLLGLTLVAGCSRKEQSLQKYADSTLTAGTGLGDLRLGKTTLDWFIKNIGKGKLSLAVGDESAFDFGFNDGQIAFQFLIKGACDRQIAVSRDLRSATRDLEAYLAKHPGCRDLTLSSISVARGSSPGSTFFKGATGHGGRLGSPVTTAVKHGDARNATARMMAGLSPNNPPDVIEYRGIAFHYDRGASGKMEDTAIKRITIFSAEE